MKRPIALYWLSFFLLFLAFGGLYGGIAMLLDPSGGSLDMAGILPLLPVSSFVLPGLFLLVGMGLTPIALVYALLAHPVRPGDDALSHPPALLPAASHPAGDRA